MMPGSKRSIIAILLGTIVCFLLACFVRPTCFAPFLGVLITIYTGKIIVPKEGAILGALVPVPAGIYATIPVFVHSYQQAQSSSATLSLIFAGVAGILIFLLAGALYGFVLGKIFQILNKKETLIL